MNILKAFGLVAAIALGALMILIAMNNIKGMTDAGMCLEEVKVMCWNQLTQSSRKCI